MRPAIYARKVVRQIEREMIRDGISLLQYCENNNLVYGSVYQAMKRYSISPRNNPFFIEKKKKLKARRIEVKMKEHSIDKNAKSLIREFPKANLVVQKVKSLKGHEIDRLSTQDYMRIVGAYSPSAYGFHLQRRFNNVFGLKDVSPLDDNGDAINDKQQSIEIKNSIITPHNRSINLRQVRDWQNIDYHYVVVVDITSQECEFEVAIYKLNHAQMQREWVDNGGVYTHIAKKSRLGNKNLMKSITIKYDDQNHQIQRWEKYRQPDMEKMYVAYPGKR